MISSRKPNPSNPRANFILFTILMLLVGAIIGAAYTKPEVKNIVIYQKSTAQKTISGERMVVMKLPAVTANNSGVSAEVRVGAKPGTGKIFVSVDDVLAAPEVEQSARMAVLVASNYTGVDSNKVDFTYDLFADASMLEGPSAGAAFTAATVAALLNKTVSPSVMMTGTINHDGTIGPAGKILEKAKAAKNAGATTFLVPVGLSTDVNYTTGEYCGVWGTTEYCEPEIMPEVIDIENVSGISVVEVRNLESAMKYVLV